MRLLPSSTQTLNKQGSKSNKTEDIKSMSEVIFFTSLFLYLFNLV